MKSLSSLSSSVMASSTLAIDSMAKQMKADGIDVIGFGTGEPDFATPANIVEAANRAMAENKTKYTPASGIMELKKAVCYRMKEDCNLDYEPANCFIASGAKHNVYLALQALVNPGDEVILPAPYWVSYYEMIRLAGGKAVSVYCGEAEDFKLTAEKLEAAITPATKCMILNNPSNPTGMMYTEQELRALADVCVKHDLYVISDEIYYCLVYDDNKFVSFATLGEEVKQRTIVINGVSKAYSMTGWRVGYALANKEITGVMSRYASHSTGAPSTISQWAAVEALTGQQESRESMRQAFEARRNYIVSRMNQIEGVSCLNPQGAFYVMMNLKNILGKTLYGTKITDCDVFGKLFLDKGLVAIVPGSGFDAPEYVRWSYATSMENIKKGLDRLEKFLKG
ncbi:MAG: pyridoxal phosphate-dependent aminotransferase [Oscillospiraceae bacterium]|nr:pyridoxal phosphate-dependent aminotransferase [Oscillospiraceae bacterium]